MVNTSGFNLILYFVFYLVFTQFYKIATKSSKDDGALTVLIKI